jgi:hypothetical protein
MDRRRMQGRRGRRRKRVGDKEGRRLGENLVEHGSRRKTTY